MSLSDFEVVLFKNKHKKNSEDIHKQIKDQFSSSGYALTIVDTNVKWTPELLRDVYEGLKNIEVTEDMVKNKEKKMVILQARNFRDEDLQKVKEVINDALIDYSIDIVLLDEKIKLEKADTFFRRVSRHLKIHNEVKKRKKDEYREQSKED